MISEAQRAALAKLATVLAPDFYLAGGVAIAAHLDHRTSRDLDVFAPSDPTKLLPELERLPGVTITSTAAGIIEFTGRPLAAWVQVFVTKHPQVDVGHLLRSLVYFGQATPLPRGLDATRWAAIRGDFEAWVKALMRPAP